MHSTPATLSERARQGILLVLALVLAVVALPGTSASAHNVVAGTVPAAGETVTDSPLEIRITTNDELLDLGGTGSGFAIVVRDTDGLYYGDGCVDIGTTDMGTTVTLGAAGTYTVTFQFVSADGHSLSDSFTFSFDQTANHTPTTGVTDPPQCGVPAVPNDSSEEPSPDTPVSSDSDDAGAPTVDVAPTGGIEPATESSEPERGIITIAIAGVLIVLSITLLVWMVRRRK